MVTSFGTDAAVIRSNSIGTGVRGGEVLGNGRSGVFLTNSFAVVALNVIANNGSEGIYADNFETITGNRIVSNGGSGGDGPDPGIRVVGVGATIGGTGDDARNIISGNAGDGITITSPGGSIGGAVVQGNIIGSDQSTTYSPFGNGGDGVRIVATGESPRSGSNNVIGDPVGSSSFSAGNVIAFNGGNGVSISGPDGGIPLNDSVLGNSIFSNARLGIDLGNDGPTANGSHAGQPGPNHWQEAPVITLAQVVNNADSQFVRLAASLQSTPSTTFRIDFLEDVAGSITVSRQSGNFVGTTMVTTDSNGKATITGQYSGYGPGTFYATATDPNGNTSEFSTIPQGPGVATADLSITGASSPTTTTVGNAVTYTFIVSNAGPDAAAGVTLAEALPFGAKFVSSSVGTLAPDGRSILAALGAIPSGTGVSVTVTIIPQAVGTFTVTASVAATSTDPTPSDESAAATVVVGLAAPTNVTAAFDGKAVILQWSPTPGASSYNVYRAALGGAEALYLPGVTGTAIADSRVAAGSAYAYVVTAVSGPLEGPPSNQAPVYVPAVAAPPPVPTPLPPPVPTPLLPVVPSNVFASYLARPDGSLTPFITWGNPAALAGATRFNVYRSTTAGVTGAVPYAANVSAHYLVDPSPTPGAVYHYQITAIVNGVERRDPRP